MSVLHGWCSRFVLLLTHTNGQAKILTTIIRDVQNETGRGKCKVNIMGSKRTFLAKTRESYIR